MPTDVLSFLRRAANIAPARAAIAFPGGKVNYAELLARVRAVAESLPPPTAEGGEAVAVLTEHDWQAPELYLGVMARGHAAVPVSSRLPDEAIARIVSKAGARVGLAAPSAAGRLKGLRCVADRTQWRLHGSSDEARALLPERIRSLPAGTAMVCFTSGTTGEPKGVILTHDNLVVHGLTSALAFRMNEGDVQVNPMPLAHFSGASRTVSTLVNLNTHVILPGYAPEEVFNAVAGFRGTHVLAAPTMVKDMLAAGPERFDLSTLRILIFGTAPMAMPVVRELMHRMKCGLFNGYGATESSAVAACLTPEQHLQALAEGDEMLLASVGRPVPGVELRILDTAHREVPAGEAGQVALRGPKVSPGYLDNPAETAARFLPEGWLLTGDQGKIIPEGNLLLLGRIDDMIISGGLNVQPGEIEREVLQLEAVADCAAFGVASDRWGQEVRLAIVAAAGRSVDTAAVRQFLRQRLDPYKVPKRIHVFDRLPRTSVGKVQRFRLAAACRMLQDDSSGHIPDD